MRAPRPQFCLALVGALVLGGCSTPGPLHLYSIANGGTDVHDIAIGPSDIATDVPSYLESAEQLTGFAYDPFTDHFFLRLAPGNHIRVVDRPARKIKREFDVEGVEIVGGGDIAVSPRDGHVYFVDPRSATLIETSRLGKYVGRIALAGRTRPALAVAFDMNRNELLVLDPDHRTLSRYGLKGEALRSVRLDRPVEASLGYDAEGRQLFAPLAGSVNEVGVFNDAGQWLRTVTIKDPNGLIDVGPHSFFRMF